MNLHTSAQSSIFFHFSALFLSSLLVLICTIIWSCCLSAGEPGQFLLLTSHDLPRSLHHPHIGACREGSFSGGGLPRSEVVQVRVQTSPLSSHRLDQRSTSLQGAGRTWQLEEADIFLSSTSPNVFPLSSSVLSLYASQPPPNSLSGRGRVARS